MKSGTDIGRSLGLFGATGVGVGAIVGGGVLALAGVAFSAAGPAAILAFALNGLIAIVTALTFAEMATAFPESGGVYAFSRRVLSIQAAFGFGWVVWFASMVAAALYALGFATFALLILERLAGMLLPEGAPWVRSQAAGTVLAIGAVAFYLRSLLRKVTGGGQWATWGKVAVFVLLLAGGLWAVTADPGAAAVQMQPFLPMGMRGLFEAMGFTFIAIQGFDLIAAVAGEVKQPERNIPRSMLLSLGIALVIYMPFLFVTAAFGAAPGQTIAGAAAAELEAIVAIAAENYLGPPGYWLVTLAGVLSMLSALQANLLAASRVALAMARDRTLPHALATVHPGRGTPAKSLAATAAIITGILLLLRDVSAAGAASSLIFLITFALAHLICILARRRGGTEHAPFRVPWFPWLPAAGATVCLSLALFQGISVPRAGVISAVWLGTGGVLFLLLFARRARVVDASAEAVDPQLVRLRGRSPLVLVPIANPANAEAMVAVANALAVPEVGRVLLLSVIHPPRSWETGVHPQQLLDTQAVLREALTASFAAGLAPEALATVAAVAWAEIGRVARTYRCESLLLGLGRLDERVMDGDLERLVNMVDCDVVFLRAQPGWRLGDVRRILVPVGGRGDHDRLRARLLGSLYRTAPRETTFLRVVTEELSDGVFSRYQRELSRLALDEVPGPAQALLIRGSDVAAAVASHAAENDLTIFGLRRLGRKQKIFGDVPLGIAQDTSKAILFISRRG
ncbi:MAG: amino acid permease [Acidobacteriota bacterium]